MENLAEILAQGHGGNARTLRDDSLLSEAKELRSEFMKRSRGQVIAAEEAFLVCKKNVEDTKYEVELEWHTVFISVKKKERNRNSS